MAYLSDIEIAQQCKMKPIMDSPLAREPSYQHKTMSIPTGKSELFVTVMAVDRKSVV